MEAGAGGEGSGLGGVTVEGWGCSLVERSCVLAGLLVGEGSGVEGKLGSVGGGEEDAYVIRVGDYRGEVVQRDGSKYEANRARSSESDGRDARGASWRWSTALAAPRAVPEQRQS